MSKESIFNALILLSFISFGVFGSLSHIFNLAVILVITLSFFKSQTFFSVNSASKKLYCALSGVFFVFVFRGMFHSDTWVSIKSLSPMVPLPLIGLAILLTNSESFNIRAQRLETFAKIAIVSTFVTYLVFSKSLAFQFGLTKHFLGRLEIFSGNPIPFSAAVFGITVFCLCNWKHSTVIQKLLSICCLFIGFWLAGIASGTRGTFLAIIISIPIFIWLTTHSFSLLLLIPFGACTFFWLLYMNGVSIFDNDHGTRIKNGLDTLLNKDISDNSIRLKLDMWAASLSAIRDNPFWGYDISNKFTALSTYLPETFKNKFTHPHNDILAGTIGAGLIGGLFSFVSLFSPVWAALLSEDNTKEKLLLGTLVSLGVFITANVNTVFFNDITAAWLAFATFLIWNFSYRKKMI